MLLSLGPCARSPKEAGIPGAARSFAPATLTIALIFRRCLPRCLGLTLLIAAQALSFAQDGRLVSPPNAAQAGYLPPRVRQAQRFLSHRAGRPPREAAGRPGPHARAVATTAHLAPSTATWQPLGPTRVITPDFGVVTGRISSLALDPSDASGNSLFVGTTGGGVWQAKNAAAANTERIQFLPLTDNLAAMTN